MLPNSNFPSTYQMERWNKAERKGGLKSIKMWCVFDEIIRAIVCKIDENNEVRFWSILLAKQYSCTNICCNDNM